MKVSAFVKGFFNFLWKTALVVIAVYYVLDFCNVSINDITRHFDTKGQVLESLNERIDLYIFRDRKYRLYDNKLGKFISKKYEMIEFSGNGDSIAVFRKDNERYGYLNINTGKVIVPAKLKFATAFSNDIAAIVPGNDDRIHFINTTFRDTISTTFYFNSWRPYEFTKSGYCIVSDGKYNSVGVIDSKGDWVIAPMYSSIEEYDDAPYYEITTEDSKYGVLDSCFRWTVEPTYEYITQTEDRTALYAVDSNGQEMISYDGEVIMPFLIGNARDLTYDISMKNHSGEYTDIPIISDKVCSFQVIHRTGGYKYGLMDKHTGQVIIPARYDDIGLVSEDIVKCGLDGYSYRLFGINGKPIPAEF